MVTTRSEAAKAPDMAAGEAEAVATANGEAEAVATANDATDVSNTAAGSLASSTTGLSLQSEKEEEEKPLAAPETEATAPAPTTTTATTATATEEGDTETTPTVEQREESDDKQSPTASKPASSPLSSSLEENLPEKSEGGAQKPETTTAATSTPTATTTTEEEDTETTPSVEKQTPRKEAPPPSEKTQPLREEEAKTDSVDKSSPKVDVDDVDDYGSDLDSNASTVSYSPPHSRRPESSEWFNNDEVRANLRKASKGASKTIPENKSADSSQPKKKKKKKKKETAAEKKKREEGEQRRADNFAGFAEKIKRRREHPLFGKGGGNKKGNDKPTPATSASSNGSRDNTAGSKKAPRATSASSNGSRDNTAVNKKGPSPSSASRLKPPAAASGLSCAGALRRGRTSTATASKATPVTPGSVPGSAQSSKKGRTTRNSLDRSYLDPLSSDASTPAATSSKKRNASPTASTPLHSSTKKQKRDNNNNAAAAAAAAAATRATKKQKPQQQQQQQQAKKRKVKPIQFVGQPPRYPLDIKGDGVRNETAVVLKYLQQLGTMTTPPDGEDFGPRYIQGAFFFSEKLPNRPCRPSKEEEAGNPSVTARKTPRLLFVSANPKNRETVRDILFGDAPKEVSIVSPEEAMEELFNPAAVNKNANEVKPDPDGNVKNAAVHVAPTDEPDRKQPAVDFSFAMKREEKYESAAATAADYDFFGVDSVAMNHQDNLTASENPFAAAYTTKPGETDDDDNNNNNDPTSYMI